MVLFNIKADRFPPNLCRSTGVPRPLFQRVYRRRFDKRHQQRKENWPGRRHE